MKQIQQHTIQQIKETGDIKSVISQINLALKLLNDNAYIITNQSRSIFSGVQTLSATDQITRNNDFLQVQGSGGAVTLTSVPTISKGDIDGEYLLIMGIDDTNTVTLQDKTSLTGTTLELGGSDVTLGAGDILELVYSKTLGLWCKI